MPPLSNGDQHLPWSHKKTRRGGLGGSEGKPLLHQGVTGMARTVSAGVCQGKGRIG
jgi:hypothetical protein